MNGHDAQGVAAYGPQTDEEWEEMQDAEAEYERLRADEYDDAMALIAEETINDR